MQESELAVMRAAIASEARVAKRHPDDEAVAARLAHARREYRTALIAGFITKTLAQAPPLTGAQRDRLAQLLTGTAGSVSAA